MEYPSPSLQINVCRHLFLGVLAVLLVLLPSPAAKGAPLVYQQSFASPENGIPTDWAVAGGFRSTDGVASITSLDDVNWLHQRRVEGANGNSLVYYSGSFGAVENGILSDFTASAILRISAGVNGDGRGIIVRGSGTTVAPSGYFVYIDENQLRISVNPTNATTGRGTLLASEALSQQLTAGTEYLFSVSAEGAIISGSLHLWNAETESVSTLLGQVSVEHNAYSEGYFGLRSSFSSNNRSTYWRNVELTAIPEPSSAALLLVPAFALYLFRCK